MTDAIDSVNWSGCGGCFLPGGCPHYSLAANDVERGFKRWREKQRLDVDMQEVFAAGAHWGQFVARNKIAMAMRESRP